MGTHILRSFLRAENANSLPEFALVITLVSVMIIGIIEFGLASWQKNTVAYDAREGARYASVHGSTSGRIATPDSVTKYVKSRSTLDTAQMSVYTSWDPDKTPTSKVTVSVAHFVPRRGPFLRAHRDSATSTVYVSF